MDTSVDLSVPIQFPGLHLSFNVSPYVFTIGQFTIKWYGILIAAGLLLALIYGLKRAPSFNVSEDNLTDIVIFSLIFGIIGARLYYVLFYIDETGVNPYWSDPASIFQIWRGGLGIYGGIIAAFLTAFIVCKIKKISVGAVYDIAGLGFLIGQAVGRWGNFFNREAYGAQTSLPWRMVVDASGTGYSPCFLYESLWCILGFLLLHIYSKHRKFNGEIFLLYVIWYGVERFFVEGLRLDSLMLGSMKISQLVAAVTVFAAILMILYKRSKLTEEREKAEVSNYAPIFEDTAKAVKAETEDLEKEQAGTEDKTVKVPQNQNTAGQTIEGSIDSDGSNAKTDNENDADSGHSEER